METHYKSKMDLEQKLVSNLDPSLQFVKDLSYTERNVYLIKEDQQSYILKYGTTNKCFVKYVFKERDALLKAEGISEVPYFQAFYEERCCWNSEGILSWN